MTNLNKLAVSLTKHGAHKVADLLERFQPDEVIANTWDRFSGIKIDAAQARKILSALQGDKLPEVWHSVKTAGRPSINGLVLLAIIFSHHSLIEAMRDGVASYGVGTIRREDLDGGKAFTNLKNDFEELNFATELKQASFRFDIRPILRDQNLGRLAASLFRAKLLEANWSTDNDVVEECLRVKFHDALGLSEDRFRQWTTGRTENLDELVEAKDPDSTDGGAFIFRHGHRERKSGDVMKKGHGETGPARLIHNELQNKIYAHLVSTHGESNVGTELTGGPPQTSIDLVVKTKGGYTFYEIKTSKSLRKCIREAVPQLLEYAYWPSDDRATQLVIVTMNTPTKDAKKYLVHLRNRFKLPVYHETVNRETGELSSRV